MINALNALITQQPLDELPVASSAGGGWVPGAKPAPSMARGSAQGQNTPAKRSPMMNALSGAGMFLLGGESYDKGRTARMNRQAGNALAQNDYKRAAQIYFQGGDIEQGKLMQADGEKYATQQRQEEAQKLLQLFSAMQPAQINEFAMADPAGFEAYTGMSSEEYLQSAQRMMQVGMSPEQFHSMVIQRAQAELGVEAKPAKYGLDLQTVLGPDGKPMLAQTTDAGGLRPIEGYTPYQEPDMEQVTLADGIYEYPRGQPDKKVKIGEAPARSPLVSVNTGDTAAGQRPIIDKPPKDYQAVWDDAAGTYRFEPIPGSETARNLESGAIKSNTAINLADQQFELMSSTIDKAIEQADFWSAGLMAQATSGLGATPARNLKATLDTIMANIGFEKLQEMRETSPTGGALGNVTERELAFLQSVRGSLDQIQDPAQLRATLQQVKESLAIIHEIRKMNLQGTLTNSGERIPTGNVERATDLPPGFEIVK